MVSVGKRGVVRGSMTHPCQELRAAHPGDVHGGRGAWTSSKKPGAWLSAGACQLPGAPQQQDVGEDNGFNVLGEEKIGALRYDLAAAEVTTLYGQPAERGPIEEWGADGAFHQTWEYPALGLTLDMVSRTEKGAQKVGSVTARAPSTLATAQGLTIGSPRRAVLERYGKVRDTDSPADDKERFVAGSIYGGLFFHFKNDVVVEMFLGAGAE